MSAKNQGHNLCLHEWNWHLNNRVCTNWVVFLNDTILLLPLFLPLLHIHEQRFSKVICAENKRSGYNLIMLFQQHCEMWWKIGKHCIKLKAARKKYSNTRYSRICYIRSKIMFDFSENVKSRYIVFFHKRTGKYFWGSFSAHMRNEIEHEKIKDTTRNW